MPAAPAPSHPIRLQRLPLPGHSQLDDAKSAPSVFHAGELEMQRRAGALERLAEIGPRVIRDHMPQQHRDFFAKLCFVVLGASDAEGQPWVTAIAGSEGFIQSPDDRRLRVTAARDPGDPVLRVLHPGSALGLLGIEPQTRRRNRMNGRITAHGETGFEAQVDMSFGNCPKYIQARCPSLADSVAAMAQPPELLAGLDPAAHDLIERADTFFIATAHPAARDPQASAADGADVSHRGGKPGFVRVEGQALIVPDFVGNFYFNTLGNLLVEPRCGLLFIDFERGDLLHLSARGEVLQLADAGKSYAGAQRLLRLHITGGLRRRSALPLRWSPAQLSPNLASTGDWQ
jgi:predicted pyridoxine 5'-phosphate oxidase superfamily flavin-nucleotide-binding protein